MNPQLDPTSAFGASSSSYLHIEDDMCPSCGRAIPLEKLEEIRGKIALREREQALAITTKLEQQYEIEKAQAVAKANAALQTRIIEAESSKIAAEQKGTALLLQLDELRKAERWKSRK
jgi:hypothetical protein